MPTALCLTLLGAATASHGALPRGTLEYLQPVATMAATAAAPVWLRFTLNTDSSPLSFASHPLTGFAATDLPATGQRWDPDTQQNIEVPFAQINRAMLQSWISCDSSFFTGCGEGGSYQYDWNPQGSGQPALSGLDSFNLLPGEHTDFLMLTLVPRNGSAAPGTYRLFTSGLQIQFEGVDASGAAVYAWAGLDALCTGGNSACAFTRTVLAVPEPASYGMLALGLLGVAAALRARRLA